MRSTAAALFPENKRIELNDVNSKRIGRHVRGTGGRFAGDIGRIDPQRDGLVAGAFQSTLPTTKWVTPAPYANGVVAFNTPAGLELFISMPMLPLVVALPAVPVPIWPMAIRSDLSNPGAAAPAGPKNDKLVVRSVSRCFDG